MARSAADGYVVTVDRTLSSPIALDPGSHLLQQGCAVPLARRLPGDRHGTVHPLNEEPPAMITSLNHLGRGEVSSGRFLTTLVGSTQSAR